MSLAALVSTYGYAAVGIGAFVEGETLLVLGGLAAQRGYLELPWVIVSAGTGAFIGDQMFYYLGRIKGRSALERRPAWKRRSEKVLILLERNQVWFILAFRFLYGLRSVSPLIIGVSNVPPVRFLVLDIIGASIWATLIGSLGYLFGRAVQQIFSDIEKYEMLAFALVAAIGIIIWLYHFLKRS